MVTGERKTPWHIRTILFVMCICHKGRSLLLEHNISHGTGSLCGKISCSLQGLPCISALYMHFINSVNDRLDHEVTLARCRVHGTGCLVLYTFEDVSISELVVSDISLSQYLYFVQ